MPREHGLRVKPAMTAGEASSPRNDKKVSCMASVADGPFGEPVFIPKMRSYPRKTMNIHKELDTRGLNCPLPILKAKKALAAMESGQLLRVVSTDAGSTRDFQAFAQQTGNDLMDQQTVGNEFIHVLKRR